MSKAVATQANSSLPANLMEEMQADAKALFDNLQTSTNRISTTNKAYTLPDGTVVGDSIQLVVLGYVNTHTMYKDAQYNANVRNEVICSAIGNPKLQSKAMYPSATSIDRQSDCCQNEDGIAVCPMNEFGSHGSGKRCKNEFLMAVCLPEDDKVMHLKIPVTARKEIQNNLAGVMKSYGHVCAGVSTFKFDPKQSYPLPIITTADPNPNTEMHFALSKDAMDDLLRDMKTDDKY